jgi:alpha-ketoglutarate-dependent taurine dioxygenase
MNADGVRVRPLSAAGPVEVLSVDLAAPLPDRVAARLRGAWRDNGVLVFRDQRLDDDGQLRAARIFGGSRATSATWTRRTATSRTSPPAASTPTAASASTWTTRSRPSRSPA